MKKLFKDFTGYIILSILMLVQLPANAQVAASKGAVPIWADTSVHPTSPRILIYETDGLTYIWNGTLYKKVQTGTVSLTTGVSGILPVANGGTGLSALGTGIATWWTTPSSANLRAAITDETGTGVAVFNNTPTIVTPSFTTGFTIGGAAASRKILVGNGTNFVTSTETLAAPGTSGNVLTSDGTNWLSSAPAAGGVTTLAAIGSTANANGATISSSTLNLQPASASFGGVVTTGSQTFAGAKTFSSNITANGVTVGVGFASSGSGNTAVGFLVLSQNTAGANNTGVGATALFNNKGDYNTAVGASAATGQSSINGGNTGIQNVAIGGLTLGGGGGLGYTAASNNVASGYKALANATSASSNTAVGANALLLATTVKFATAIGDSALAKNTANSNTAVGYQAGSANTSGTENTSVGYTASLLSTGFGNTSLGHAALAANTAGSYSTAIGAYALQTTNSGAGPNTAVGYQSMQNTTSSAGSTALGYHSIYGSNSGGTNTGLGYETLNGVTSGASNTAVGYRPLYATTTGYSNIASGNYCLYGNTIGFGNTGYGDSTLLDNISGSSNTAVGYKTGLGLTTGSGNTIIGSNISGLASGLTNNILVASGAGVKAQHDGTNWTLTGGTIVTGNLSAANLTSGTYTPTLTGVTNVTSSTPANCQYIRNGNTVIVYGSLQVTTTLAVATEVDISLPVASNIAAATDANGVGNASSAIGTNGYVDGDATNDRARLNFIGLAVGGSGTIFFSFSYTIL